MPVLDKRVTKLQKIAKLAQAKLDIAAVYLDDGAPATAAARYREAADLLDQWAALRNKIVEG